MKPGIIRIGVGFGLSVGVNPKSWQRCFTGHKQFVSIYLKEIEREKERERERAREREPERGEERIREGRRENKRDI